MTGKTVLVADDDEAIRALLQLHLVHAGYDVLLAEDAVAAGRMLYSSPPDLLIIEVILPYLSGLEFVATMMTDATAPQVPVILISGHERFVEQAKILGVDCLVKPFFADQLLESVARTLERTSAADVA
jgi:two-component system phosphate regulon response regulator PhoB